MIKGEFIMKLHKQTILDVLNLALPAVGENILYMMIGVFDTMMVGKYGGNIAVSSVGLSSEIIYTFSNIFVGVGVSVGITSLVARRVGAKDLKKAEEYATLGFVVAGILALLLSTSLIFFSKNILTFAGADENVVSLGSPYMSIAGIGIFFNMLMNALNATLRAFGNTRTPLIASALVNVTNIFLDWSLIFGRFGLPELGVIGAALATAIAQFLGFVFISLYMYYKSDIKLNFSYLKNVNRDALRHLFKLSGPSSLQEASLNISRLLCNFMIISLGTISFASNQIATTIESISFMPGWGFSVAATTLVGHKIGEKNFDKAKEYAKASIFLGTALMFVCSFLFLFIPNVLIKLFITSSEVEVIKLGTQCLMVAAIEQPVMGLSMVVGGALKGVGDTKTPFMVSFISSWFIRFPLMFYFIYIKKYSVVLVWVITAIQWAFDGIVICYLFNKTLHKKFKAK